MDFVFNRGSGVPVRNQLMAQLEMKILEGAVPPGERLPSVRALARRLSLHPNTVAAAYHDLQVAGRVEVRRGSGVYARGRFAERVEEAQGLDEMILVALALARRKGFSVREVRTAVERWLAAAPPDRVVVIDRSRAMAELLAHELDARLGVRAECASIEEAAADPGRLDGAVAVTLAWHAAEVQRLAPTTRVEILTLKMSDGERAALRGLPAGSIVLLVSHSPTVLPYARKLISSLRGDELLVEAHPLAESAAWRRLAPAADLVIADALAAPEVRRAGPRRLRELRLVRDDALERLAPLLSFASPAAGVPDAAGTTAEAGADGGEPEPPARRKSPARRAAAHPPTRG